jgi:hypothetical protein
MKEKLFKGPEKKFLLGISVTLALMQLGLLLVMPFHPGIPPDSLR